MILTMSLLVNMILSYEEKVEFKHEGQPVTLKMTMIIQRHGVVVSK